MEKRWNPNPKGNPNIGEISKKTSTGPKSEEGKLRIQASHNRGKELENKFKKAGLSMEAYKLFSFFVRSHQTKGLQEITRLEDVIGVLETDFSMRALSKIEQGLPLDPDDIKQIKLLKESLVDLHKMKYGEKRLNVNASYQDIQNMMFGEDPGQENPEGKGYKQMGEAVKDVREEANKKIRENDSQRDN